MKNKIKTFLYNIKLFFDFVFGKVKKYKYGKSKSKLQIFYELTKWMFREKQFNKMYYAFGLNIQHTFLDDYIGKNEILYYKKKIEAKLKNEAKNKLNYDVITKDKFYANAILNANNIDVIKTLAVIYKDKFILDNKVKKITEIFNLNYPFVLKNNILEAGEGILIGNFNNGNLFLNGKIIKDITQLKRKLGKSVWVLQKKIISHNRIRKINDSALNTTRIVTILNGDKPEYLTGFQAFAINGIKIDSWSKGSIYVGIDSKTYKLKEDGYYNPWIKNKSITKVHPDTNIQFKDYDIPYLKEAIELCVYAHNLYFYNFILGWDVAITDEGPLILEVNENPGMNAVQCVDGGLKKKFLEYAKRCLEQ